MARLMTQNEKGVLKTALSPRRRTICIGESSADALEKTVPPDIIKASINHLTGSRDNLLVFPLVEVRYLLSHFLSNFLT